MKPCVTFYFPHALTNSPAYRHSYNCHYQTYFIIAIIIVSIKFLKNDDEGSTISSFFFIFYFHLLPLTAPFAFISTFSFTLFFLHHHTKNVNSIKFFFVKLFEKINSFGSVSLIRIHALNALKCTTFIVQLNYAYSFT